MSDRPSRTFCDGLLARFGVETGYFDPLVGAGIADLFRPNTAAVMIEARTYRYGWPSISDPRSISRDGWRHGPKSRAYIGLENVEDLKADLELGFAAFNAAQA